MESGEYFMNEKQRQQKVRVDKRMKAAETAQERRNERMKDYVAPKEPTLKKKKKKKSGAGAGAGAGGNEGGEGSFALEASGGALTGAGGATGKSKSKSKKKSIESLKQSFLAKTPSTQVTTTNGKKKL